MFPVKISVMPAAIIDRTITIFYGGFILKRNLFPNFAVLLCMVFLINLCDLGPRVEIESNSLTGDTAEAHQNYAPIAENLSFTTYRGVSINGFFKPWITRRYVSYRLVSSPKKGTVQVSKEICLYSKNGKKARIRLPSSP
jgi:hypothetical protein